MLHNGSITTVHSTNLSKLQPQPTNTHSGAITNQIEATCRQFVHQNTNWQFKSQWNETAHWPASMCGHCPHDCPWLWTIMSLVPHQIGTCTLRGTGTTFNIYLYKQFHWFILYIQFLLLQVHLCTVVQQSNCSSSTGTLLHHWKHPLLHHPVFHHLPPHQHKDAFFR